MKNFRLVLSLGLLAVLSLLAGCSGVASTASGGQAPQTTASASVATPTSAGAVQTATATPVSAQVVQVTISDQQISADRSTLYMGIPYHFVVTNTSQAPYQFMMGQGGWNDGHMPMGWRHQMTPYWSAQIAQGATTTFDYTFPAGAVGPRFGFGCYQQGAIGGMWYPLTIQSHP